MITNIVETTIWPSVISKLKKLQGFGFFLINVTKPNLNDAVPQRCKSGSPCEKTGLFHHDHHGLLSRIFTDCLSSEKMIIPTS